MRADGRKLIAAVGLPDLAARLDEEAHWNRMLSLGEQQRLGIARAILHAPDYLFLDEATASLDEPAEAALYRLLRAAAAHATIVSIGHRSTLAAFHRRGSTLSTREGEAYALREAHAWRRRPIKKKGGGRFQPPPNQGQVFQSYFKLPSVRSADSLAMKAAPHQFDCEPTGLIEVACRRRRAGIAGEGRAFVLAQIGVAVAQVEREHLPGEAEADVPGVVVGSGMPWKSGPTPARTP